MKYRGPSNTRVPPVTMIPQYVVRRPLYILELGQAVAGIRAFLVGPSSAVHSLGVTHPPAASSRAIDQNRVLAAAS